jgi:hypothetical protein
VVGQGGRWVMGGCRDVVVEFCIVCVVVCYATNRCCCALCGWFNGKVVDGLVCWIVWV